MIGFGQVDLTIAEDYIYGRSNKIYTELENKGYESTTDEERIFIYFFISVIFFILFAFSIYRIADNLDKAGYELNNTSLSKAGRILMWLVAILVILFFISLIYLFFLLS